MLVKKPNRIGEVGEEKEGAYGSDLMESSFRDRKRKSTPRLRCVNSAPQTTSASVLGFQLEGNLSCHDTYPTSD